MTPPPAFDPVRHRRGGRPRKAEAERRVQFIRIRVTPAQQAAASARAQAAGLSLAEYGRAALDGAPVHVIVSQTAPPELIQQLRLIGINLNQALVEAREGRFSRPGTEAALFEAARIVSAELRRLLHGPEC